MLRVCPHPCSQAQDDLSSLSGTQQLWDDLCHQTDEVHQLVVLHHAVLLHHPPHEGGHQPHRRDEEVEGGRGKRGACTGHVRLFINC